MRLLITTQSIDPNHSVLGFFVRWIDEFKKHCEVEVFALKAERGSRFARAMAFVTFAFSRQYDAVFVHMNPEYVVALGWWWRLRGKKVGLWYTHKNVDLKLRIAARFADVIFTASKESFRLQSSKVRVMGHGIDTDFFTPAAVERGEWALSVGRLSKNKRHDAAIRTAHEQGRTLLIAGEGPERANLEHLARQRGAHVTFLGPLTQTQLREEYRKAAYLIHTSETGSLDKVVLEAAACGCPVQSTNPEIASMPLSPEYVRREHSLQSLIPRILNSY